MRIAYLIMKINFFPTLLCAKVLTPLIDPSIALLEYAQKRRRFNCDRWDMMGLHLQRRAAALSEEVKRASHLPEKRQVELRNAAMALRTEANNYCARVKFRLALPTSLVVIKPVVGYLNQKLLRRQQKMIAFEALISRVDSDTFYFDLILWFFLPVDFSEALLGDLNEEYLIRKSTDGPVRARTWYRHQVGTTAKDFLWRKIERLAAIGTLLDLLFRSHKK
jgi:hypothetical protein